MKETMILVAAVVVIVALVLILRPAAPDPQPGDRFPDPPPNIGPTTLEITGTGAYTITGADGRQAVLEGPLTIEGK